MTGEERWMECPPGRVILSSSLNLENVIVEGWVQLRRNEALVIELDV